LCHIFYSLIHPLFCYLLTTPTTTTTGSIEAAELAPLLRTLKVPCSEEELLLLVAEMDSDKSGDVDYEEFEAWYNISAHRNRTLANLEIILHHFDAFFLLKFIKAFLKG